MRELTAGHGEAENILQCSSSRLNIHRYSTIDQRCDSMTNFGHEMAIANSYRDLLLGKQVSVSSFQMFAFEVTTLTVRVAKRSDKYHS